MNPARTTLFIVASGLALSAMSRETSTQSPDFVYTVTEIPTAGGRTNVGLAMSSGGFPTVVGHVRRPRESSTRFPTLSGAASSAARWRFRGRSRRRILTAVAKARPITMRVGATTAMRTAPPTSTSRPLETPVAAGTSAGLSPATGSSTP